MSTNPPSGGDPLRRGGRRSLTIVPIVIPDPDSIDGINAVDASNASLSADDSIRDYPKYVVPPPCSSMTKDSSFCRKSNEVDPEMSIPTPKSSNCSPKDSKNRWSLRSSKTSIAKIPRNAKHQLQDPRKLVQRFAGSDSPLCVKKKMGRRGIQNHVKATNRKIKCHRDNHTKIPTTTIASASQGTSQLTASNCTKANIQVMIPSKSFDSKLQSSAVTLTSSISSLNASHDLQCPSVVKAPKQIEVVDISADADGTIPSVLFEESVDFWNTYLLDTYHQIASCNQEVQDFEPIPYPLMARGVPVYTEKIDSDQVSEVTVRLNKSGHKVTTKEIRNGSTASLKDDSEVSSKAGESRGQAESNKGVVGPGSWQMNVINGMLIYLDEVKDSPYSKYSIQFQVTTKQCTMQHLEGNIKYRHLPGAIFEEIVHAVGGPTFLEIYNNSKTYSGDRLRRAAAAEYQRSEYKTNESPSLIQVAVGYGFCMAKSLATEDKLSASSDSNSIKYVVDHGSQKVLQMSNSHRLKFWKDHILNHDKN